VPGAKDNLSLAFADNRVRSGTLDSLATQFWQAAWVYLNTTTSHSEPEIYEAKLPV